MSARPSVLLLCLFALFSLFGCKKDVERVQRGTRLVEGSTLGLYRSPNGSHVATLTDAQRVREPGAPEDLRLGSLHLAQLPEGPARRLGGGVSNLPNALLFSSDGTWLAFLSSYSLQRARGDLQLVRTSSDAAPETLGLGVSYYVISADSAHIAWVSDGELWLRALSGGEARLVTQGVSMMAFAPPTATTATKLIIKRSQKAGGALLAYDLATRSLHALARDTRHFAIGPNGSIAFQAEALLAGSDTGLESVLKRKQPEAQAPALFLARADERPERISDEPVTEFRFSEDGERLAFLTPPRLGQTAGEVWVHDGKTTRRTVARAAAFEFAYNGELVVLAAWEPSASAGTLGVAALDGTLREVARNVKQFTLSPGRHTILFSHLVPTGGTYAMALSLQGIDAPDGTAPREVGVGVYGYAVDKTEKHLAYKAECLDQGKACTLFVTGLGAADDTRTLGKRVAAFDFLPGRNELGVVFSRHREKYDPTLLYELATVSLGAAPVTTRLDDQMSGDFLPTGGALAWIVRESGREGLYAAPVD